MSKNLVSSAALLVLLSACVENMPSEQQKAAPEPKLVTTDIAYNTNGFNMNGYLAYHESFSGKRPGILVVHEWWGHNDYVRQRAEMLAALGYVALAVDMYGDGKQATHPETAMDFSGELFSNIESARQRFEAAAEVLREHPDVNPDNISAVGYCMGGSLILAFANDGMDLDGVAAFHSGVELPIAPGESLSARVLVQNGADDPFISQESADAFKAAMDEIGAQYEYVNIPGALHAFTNPGADSLGAKFNLPLRYDREADEKSWQKFLAFLGSIYPALGQ